MGRIDRIGAERAAHRAPKSRAELAAAFADAREYTRRCYAHLADRDPTFPRVPTVNPARWELGHIGWFQEYWCRRHGGAMRPGDSAACATPSRLANADLWWDSSRVAHDTRWSLPLPDWRGIDRYLDRTLADTLEALAASRDGERTFFELALRHEDMHGEALLMTLQMLGLPPPAGLDPPPPARGAVRPGDVALRGATIAIGSREGDVRERFVFDNETGSHEVVLAPYTIARACVTEGEFAAFVDDGGYERAEFWSDEARRWRESNARALPAYWRLGEHGYEVRWFDRWRPIASASAMQHVNAHEAQAWCRWAGRRLPTEAEWEHAALVLAGDAAGANLDAGTGGPVASDAGGAGASHWIGNVWEWTASPFRPYPGFAPGPYVEYSAPWFDDHHVIRGGSWATRSRLVHPRFRNFYLPARHDMFVGFRTCATR